MTLDFSRFEIWVLGISIFCVGMGGGIFWQKMVQKSQIPAALPSISEEIAQTIPPVNSATVPVVHLHPIENGKMEIFAEFGEVRIAMPEEIPVSVFQEKIFLDMESLLPMLKTLPAPKNAQFVASKRGKTFYPLDDPNAFLTAPKNRIFFETAEQAEKVGLRRKK